MEHDLDQEGDVCTYIALISTLKNNILKVSGIMEILNPKPLHKPHPSQETNLIGQTANKKIREQHRSRQQKIYALILVSAGSASCFTASQPTAFHVLEACQQYAADDHKAS